MNVLVYKITLFLFYHSYDLFYYSFSGSLSYFSGDAELAFLKYNELSCVCLNTINSDCGYGKILKPKVLDSGDS